MKYNNFEVKFKELLIKVKLLDNEAYFPNSEEERGACEEFKINIINTINNKEINFKFYNSIMEKELSDELEKYKNAPYTYRQMYLCLKSIKMWGGYDKTKNLKELEKERIKKLLYSILNDLELNFNTDTSSFKDFCDTFGYDQDSRRAERIFKAVIELKEKIESLNLSEEFKEYLNTETQQETDKFNQDVKNAVEITK